MPTDTRTAPAVPKRTSERLCYTVEYVTNSNKYGSWEASERQATTNLQDAVLVGSRTKAGTHAPAIDVDHVSALVQRESGFDLWIDAAVPYSKYRELRNVVARLGLGPAEKMHRSERKLTRRLSEYSAVRGSVVDDTPRQDTLKVLGPELGTSFEGAMLVASNVSDTDRVGPGPGMQNPWRIPLHVEAILVPSTHNFHLYLEVELAWEAYRELLQALVGARIVQEGYLGASEARESTYLRLPWIEKPADGRLYPRSTWSDEDPF